MMKKNKIKKFKWEHGTSVSYGKKKTRPKTGGRICPECKGTGKTILRWVGMPIKSPCDRCKGRGYVV